MWLVIKFNDCDERVYDFEDVEGWKNCMLSLTQHCKKFCVEYRFK